MTFLHRTVHMHVVDGAYCQVLFSVGTNSWKIADFGFTEQAISKRLVTSRYSRGKPCYRPPELISILKAVYNNKADLWSLGCIIYEVITGEKAFFDDTAVFQYASYHALPIEFTRKRGPTSNYGLVMVYFVPELLAVNPHMRPSAQIMRQFIKISEFLISCNFQPSQILRKDELFLIALYHAITAKRADIISLLIDLNIDITVPHENGLTTLEIASQSGDIQLSKLLIKAGANGSPLLVQAAMEGELGIINTLLSAGVNIHAKAGDRRKALYEQFWDSETELLPLMRELGCNLFNPTGLRAYYMAALNGHRHIMQRLLPDVNLREVGELYDPSWSLRYETAWNHYKIASSKFITQLPSLFNPRGQDWMAIFNKNIPKMFSVDLVRTLRVPETPSRLCFSPDGKYLAAGFQTFAHIFDLKSNHEIAILDHLDDAEFETPIVVAFASDSTQCITAGWSSIITCNVNGWTVDKKIVCDPLEQITNLSCVEGRIVALSWSGDVGVWDRDNGKKLRVKIGLWDDSQWALALSPDGKYLAKGYRGGLERVELWETDGRLLEGYLKISYGEDPASLVFCPMGEKLVAEQTGGLITVWKLHSGGGFTEMDSGESYPAAQKIAEWPGRKGTARALAASNDGKWLASGYTDGIVAFWDFSRSRLNEPHFMLQTGLAELESLVFGDSSGQKIFVTGGQGEIRVWSYPPMLLDHSHELSGSLSS